MALEARALLLATLQERLKRPIAVILPGDAAIGELEAALRLFHLDPDRVAIYPNPSLSPYQEIEPSLAVAGRDPHHRSSRASRCGSAVHSGARAVPADPFAQ